MPPKRRGGSTAVKQKTEEKTLEPNIKTENGSESVANSSALNASIHVKSEESEGVVKIEVKSEESEGVVKIEKNAEGSPVKAGKRGAKKAKVESSPDKGKDATENAKPTAKARKAATAKAAEKDVEEQPSKPKAKGKKAGVPEVPSAEALAFEPRSRSDCKWIGAHVSAAGGLHNAVYNAVRTGSQ